MGSGEQREDDTESSVAGITPHTTRLFGTVTPEPNNQPKPDQPAPPTGSPQRAQTHPENNHLTQRGFVMERVRKPFAKA